MEQAGAVLARARLLTGLRLPTCPSDDQGACSDHADADDPEQDEIGTGERQRAPLLDLGRNPVNPALDPRLNHRSPGLCQRGPRDAEQQHSEDRSDEHLAFLHGSFYPLFGEPTEPQPMGPA